MKRPWSIVAILPLTVACAAVLGLEEAELDEEGGGSGGRSGAAGAGRGGRGGGLAGSVGAAGDGGAPACNYDGGDACYTECFNGMCCSQAQACFELPACSSYVDCRNACEDDADCLTDCGKSFPVGLARFNELVLCTLGCDCLGEPGEGGSGGQPATNGGTSGAGGRATGGRAGAGGSGGGTPPQGGQGGSATCDDTTPTTCPTATSVRYCDAGMLQTVACQRRCTDLGFDGGSQCVDGVCQCGEPVNVACNEGAFVYCDCYAQSGTECTAADWNFLYISCHVDDPTYGPALRCLAPFAYDEPIDCDVAGAVCIPEE